MTDIADNIKGDTVHEQDGQLESDFFRSARLAKDKLNSISPSMCLAKWSQVSLHLPTGLNNSCYHPPLHKIDPDAFREYSRTKPRFEGKILPFKELNAEGGIVGLYI